ncbi:MAG: sugar phosphate isomerase/epimerase [bacterium]
MRIGCNTVAFRKYGLDFALERIVSAGYKYVEIEANAPWCDHVNTDSDDPVRFREKTLGAGLIDISCIGAHRELIAEPGSEADIRRALEFAGAAGVKAVATGEGQMPEGMRFEEALAILKPKLERLAETAEKEKVFLCMEPHGTISLAPGGLGRILALAPSPWLCVNFDTANPRRGDYVGKTKNEIDFKLGESAKGDELAALAPVADKVRHVHWKDIVGRNAVIAGKGEVRLREELEILRDAGYDGTLSYETEGWEEADEAQAMIEESLIFTRLLLAEMRILFD